MGHRGAPRVGTGPQCLAAVGLPAALAQAGLPDGGSPWMEAVSGLFNVLTVIAGAITIAVIALTMAFAWRYRARGEGREGPMFREVYTPRQKRLLALLFVLFPAAVLALVGAVSYDVYSDFSAPPGDTVYVNVTAIQFQWVFEYSNGTTSFGTLTVPANETVVLNVTSQDVIHSFFIPEMGVKADAVPGRVNQFSFRPLTPGEYGAKCTEFCGVGHAGMNATVVVTAPDGG